MNPQTFLIIFSSAGIALFVLAVILLYLSKEGRAVLIAKLTRKPLLVRIDPDTRTVKLERIPDKELVEKKGDTFFLGGWPSYRWDGVKTFFVVENDVIDYDPKVIEEIQKALNEGIGNFEDLKDRVIEYEEREVEITLPDGQTQVQKITIPKVKLIHGRAHRILNIKSIKKGKGLSIVLEEYSPIDFVVLTNFYSRKLSAESIKKILKLKDIECLEKVERVYVKLLKKLKLDTKGGGLGFNPIWIIYIGIFVFIVLMGLSMYGGKLGGVRPLPPSP